MELSILEALGLPEGSILSVRSGPTRRQSPLPCSAPFRLPAGPWPLRIDVLALLGKSGAGASLAHLDSEGRCRVPLEARDGRKMSVTLQVYDGKAASLRPKTAPADHQLLKNKDNEEEAEPGANAPPVRRRDTEAEARSYLDRHRLHEFMHALFELLLRERPDDPYSFIAERFKEAALLEPRNAPIEAPIIEKQEKVARSLVSTAPTTTVPSNKAEEPTTSNAEGTLQIVVRNMRGRSVAKLVARPDDKISALKARLETSLGVPVVSQQLLWWGETLPNDTTLDDHGVPDSGASLHLTCGTRDPRLKLALSGSSDGGLRLWNLRDGELQREFGGGGSSVVLAMSIDWDTMRAFTGSFNGLLQLWDLSTGERLSCIQGHKEEVNVIEVDWPSMRAISGASDASAKLWSLKDSKCLFTLVAGSTVYTLAVDWANMKACGGLRSGLVRLWDLETGVVLRDFRGGLTAAEASGTGVSAVAMDCLGSRAVSGLEDGHLVYWHFSKEEVRAASASSSAVQASAEATPAAKVLLAHYTAIRTIAACWKPEGSQALCGSDDGSLSLWRLDAQECMARFARHVGYVWTLYADWTKGRALSGAFDGCFKLWDLRNGDCLRTVQSHSRPVRSIAGGS